MHEARLLPQSTNVQEARNDDLTTPAFAEDYPDLFDYNRGYDDDLELSGVMSLERSAKFACWFLPSQLDLGETSALAGLGQVVRVASHWSPKSTPMIRVFSKAEGGRVAA